jgi:hypothetical protein
VATKKTDKLLYLSTHRPTSGRYVVHHKAEYPMVRKYPDSYASFPRTSSRRPFPRVAGAVAAGT